MHLSYFPVCILAATFLPLSATQNVDNATLLRDTFVADVDALSLSELPPLPPSENTTPAVSPPPSRSTTPVPASSALHSITPSRHASAAASRSATPAPPAVPSEQSASHPATPARTASPDTRASSESGSPVQEQTAEALSLHTEALLKEAFDAPLLDLPELEVLPTFQLLEVGRTNAHLVPTVMAVLERRRREARDVNAWWTFHNLNVNHDWFLAQEGRGLLDAPSARLEVELRHYSDELNDDLLAAEDAAIDNVRFYNTVSKRILGRPIENPTFSINAVYPFAASDHRPLSPVVRGLRNLDRLTITSRRQMWNDTESRIEWPRITELKILNDHDYMDSLLPEGLLHFDAKISTLEHVRFLRLPPSLKSLNLTVLDMTIFDEHTLFIPPGLDSLSISSPKLLHFHVPHLPNLKQLRLTTSSSFDWLSFQLPKAVEQQLSVLHLHFSSAPALIDAAERFPLLEELHLVAEPGSRGNFPSLCRHLPKHLQRLRIAGVEITNQCDLRPYKALVELELHHCGLETLDPLTFPSNLQILSLRRNPLKTLLFAERTSLPRRLISLSLSEARLTRLGSRDLPSTIEVLEVHSTPIAEINLASYRNLKVVDFDRNNLRVVYDNDLPSSLVSLSLQSNPLERVCFLTGQVHLKKVRIGNAERISEIDLSHVVRLAHLALGRGLPDIGQIHLPPGLEFLYLGLVGLNAVSKTLDHLATSETRIQIVQDAWNSLGSGHFGRLPRSCKFVLTATGRRMLLQHEEIEEVIPLPRRGLVPGPFSLQ